MRTRLASVKKEDETKEVVARIDASIAKLNAMKKKIASEAEDVAKEIDNLPINKEIEKQVEKSDKELADIVEETYENSSEVTVDDGDNLNNRMGSAKKIAAAKKLVQIAAAMIAEIK